MAPLSWVLDLAEAEPDPAQLGGKAATLARLLRAGFPVLPGLVVPVSSYARFRAATGLAGFVQGELGRRPLGELRWEELWDAALRIRARYARAPLPGGLIAALRAELTARSAPEGWAVRSSAPDEDAAGHSFAGLHETILGVRGERGVCEALRRVWASRFSDAALLYRAELGLSTGSGMAALLQPISPARPAGVAFARDPRGEGRPSTQRVWVEAVPGACEELVSGAREPQRYLLEAGSGRLLERAGAEGEPLLGEAELEALAGLVARVGEELSSPPDLEWAGAGEGLVLLQARPIAAPLPADRRRYYLGLSPSDARLSALCERVSEHTIPALAEAGERLAGQELASLDEPALADALEARLAELERWRVVYEEEFIPFAHGVRRLGVYFNDHVEPRDPYAFVGLLSHEPLAALRRNAALEELAAALRAEPALREAVSAARAAASPLPALQARAPEFAARLRALCASELDVAYEGVRLGEHPEWLLALLLQLSEREATPAPRVDRAALERRLYAAVGPAREQEARDMLRLGRLAWRLRDDDNLLLGRIESQLLRAADEAAERLRAADRLGEARRMREEDAPALIAALRDSDAPVELPQPEARVETRAEVQRPAGRTRPRQLQGQPAAPGLATGRARGLRSAADLGAFRPGDVLICDAIEPTMTHLVPLCAAIVERRGGMLIHGAIIARELGIPCVNGVPRALERLADGDRVTVDGYLGIVTVLERA